MSKSDSDVSNLPSFFQVNRSSMVTVLDHLESLEEDITSDDLPLEETGIGGLEDDTGVVEEEYVDDDFDVFTSEGLPQQFASSATVSVAETQGDGKTKGSLGRDDGVAAMSRALGLEPPSTDSSLKPQNDPTPVTAAEVTGAPTMHAHVGNVGSSTASMPVPAPPMQMQMPLPPMGMPMGGPMPPMPPAPAPSSFPPIVSQEAQVNLPPAPAPVPIRQPCTFARIRNINDVKPAKYMSRYDMKFVISRILQPLNTEDPYADDYYYIQNELRKNSKAKATALEKIKGDSPNVSQVPDLIVPLPTWKETKQKLQIKIKSTQSEILQKAKEWQEKEQALGVTNRSNVRNPKKQLALDSVKDIWSGEEGSVGGEGSGAAGDLTHAFGNKLWTVRVTIQKAYDAFYAVQELDQLLKYHQGQQQYKLQAAQQHMMKLETEFNDAMVALISSTNPDSFANKVANARFVPNKIAEQEQQQQQHYARMHQMRMQVDNEQHQMHLMIADIMKERVQVMNVLAASIGIQGHDGGFTLDSNLFGAIISTLKGKKLIASLFYLLSPDHRWCIVPALLNKLLQTVDSGMTSGESVHILQEREVESKLLASFLEFVQGAHQFQQQQEQQQQGVVMQYRQVYGGVLPDTVAIPPPPAPYTPITLVLLDNISKCLASLMEIDSGSGGTGRLRLSLLSNRDRSSLLHAMIVCADAVVEFLRSAGASSEPPVTNWGQLRESFMCMLDN